MHICPHCQKLGISTYAAIGDPFSRGLASCRYCTNVSRRRGIAYYIVMPITLLLYWALMYTLRPPIEFMFFWLALFGFMGLVVIDRYVHFEKLDEAQVRVAERGVES